MALNTDIQRLFTRKHPIYSRCEPIWRRSLAAYGGGARYIGSALIKHLSEIDPEFAERRLRAYYLNYPRKVAWMITQFVLATRPIRENADADIVEDFSRTGLRVDEVMRQFCTYLSVCGSAWLVVDMPSFEGVKTKAQELKERLRPYCVALNPLAVQDWCYGPDGKLLWAIIAEHRFDNSDPMKDGQEIDIRRLWTRQDVTVISQNKTTGETSTKVISHTLGIVPLVHHIEVDGYGMGENHWFEDVVRISDAILNNESEAQMNTIKQMFGLLVIPEDFVAAIKSRPEVAAEPAASASMPISHVLARSAALFESSDSKGISRYITPSGAATASIREENLALRKELFEVIGLAISKDSKMVESAEAKAWDFQNVEHFLATRADVLEQCEGRAWEIMNMWKPQLAIPTVQYCRNFALIDLKESIAGLLELSGFLPDNDEYQREVGKTALALLSRMRQLAQEDTEKINKAIEASSPSEQRETERQVAADLAKVKSGNVDNPPQN